MKIEVEDDEGTKFTLAVEGTVSREKVMKAIEMLEMMNVPLDHDVYVADENTSFGKIMKLIETNFSTGDFSSADVARAFEETYNRPVRLSTVSTYLSRLVNRDYLIREKFGNSWVYRRTYVKTAHAAER